MNSKFPLSQPRFSSVASVCHGRPWEATWKNLDDPSAVTPARRRRDPDASRRQQRAALYQSGSAFSPAFATCLTPSVSRHILRAGQKPAAAFSCWLTEGFLHGSLHAGIAGCLRSHYRRRSGYCAVFGVWALSAAEWWVYLMNSFHRGSCKSKISSWTVWVQTWLTVRDVLSDLLLLEPLWKRPSQDPSSSNHKAATQAVKDLPQRENISSQVWLKWLEVVDLWSKSKPKLKTQDWRLLSSSSSSLLHTESN